jgi:CRISPR/Cas system-associated exonuclease Cas4 (RecB family)
LIETSSDTERVVLYDGTVIVDYHDKSHRYYLVHDDHVESVPSVTTIVSTLDKPMLIPWAVNKTLEVCREAVAPDTLHSELFLEEVWRSAKRAHKDVKEEAASIGHQVHDILHSERFEDPIEDDRVAAGVYAGRAWLESRNVKTLESERLVFSKRNTVVGRLDRIVEISGKRCLADWKTSNGVWPEMVMQVSAYKAMYEEETGERIEKVFLIHLDKVTGEFHPYEFSRRMMDRTFKRAFLPALKIHRQLKEIKRRLK